MCKFLYFPSHFFNFLSVRCKISLKCVTLQKASISELYYECSKVNADFGFYKGNSYPPLEVFSVNLEQNFIFQNIIFQKLRVNRYLNFVRLLALESWQCDLSDNLGIAMYWLVECHK